MRRPAAIAHAMVPRERAVGTIMATGARPHACVQATTREAFSRDFHTMVPEDCVADWTEELHRAAWAGTAAGCLAGDGRCPPATAPALPVR